MRPSPCCGARGSPGPTVTAKAKAFEFKIPGMQPKVSEKDLVTFTRQFATMIDAGLPLVQCLEILGSQSDNKTFATVINKVRTDVEGGRRSPRRCASTPRPSPSCT